jgi:DNA primase
VKAAEEQQMLSSSPDAFEQPDLSDPVARMEREALEVIVQVPQLLALEQWQQLTQVQFRYRMHEGVAQGVIGAASTIAPEPGAIWVNTVRSFAPEQSHALLAELTVSPIPASSQEQLARYVHDILNRLFEQQINRQKSDLLMQLQLLNADASPEEFQRIQRELMQLELQRRRIMEGQD